MVHFLNVLWLIWKIQKQTLQFFIHVYTGYNKLTSLTLCYTILTKSTIYINKKVQHFCVKKLHTIYIHIYQYACSFTSCTYFIHKHFVKNTRTTHLLTNTFLYLLYAWVKYFFTAVVTVYTLLYGCDLVPIHLIYIGIRLKK